MIRPLSLVLLTLLLSCSQEQQRPAIKRWNDPHFSVELPVSWKPFTLRGIDSYVGGVVTEDGDSLVFDWGPYSDKLNEIPVVVLSESMRENWGNTDSSNVVFVPRRRAVDEDAYRRNNLSWDTIDGMKAKLVFPIRTGKGTTGVYFDSVPSTKYRNSFVLYGINLHPQNEERLRRAVQTIRFSRAPLSQ